MDFSFGDLIDSAEGAISDVSDAVSDAVDYVSDAVSDVVDDVADAVSDAVDDVSDAVSDVADDVEDAVDYASGAVSDAIDDVSDAISDVADDVEDAVDYVSDAVSDAIDDVSDAVDDVEDAVAGATSSIADACEDWEGDVEETFAEDYKLVVGAIVNPIDNFKDWMESDRESGDPTGTGNYALDFATDLFGFTVDLDDNYAVSNRHSPIQGNVGYCRLYDDAEPAIAAVIDNEPFYFDYNGKKWMIELWKGQYGLATGCEAGVYSRDSSEVDPNADPEDIWYDCANEDDWMKMSYTLTNKNTGEVLADRSCERGWWLTQFDLGKCTSPDDLSMDVNITIKNDHKDMDIPFKEALDKAGYTYSTSESKDDDGNVNGTTINFTYDQPKSGQPWNRNEVLDKVILTGDSLGSDAYQVIKNGKKIDKEMVYDLGGKVKDVAETTAKVVANKGEEAINYIEEEIGE